MMDALILVTAWCVIGAGVELAFPGEAEGHTPWWVDALCILSWPLLLAVQVLPIAVSIATLENDDEG